MALTTGQLRDKSVGELFEADHSQRLIDAGAVIGVPILDEPAVRQSSEGHGVAHLERQRGLGVLGDDRDPLSDRAAGQRSDRVGVDEHITALEADRLVES